MKVSSKQVQCLTITDAPGLDAVTVMLEDFPGCRPDNYGGRITIQCCGAAWSYYWGAMGYPLSNFFMGAGVDYLVGKLFPDSLRDKRTVLDVDRLIVEGRKAICEARRSGEMDKATASLRWMELGSIDEESIHHGLSADILRDVFGDEWYRCLPDKPSDEWEYLKRVVLVVKEAFVLNAQQTVKDCTQVQKS